MKKKWVLMVIALLALTLFAGCAEENKPESTEATEIETAAPEPSETETGRITALPDGTRTIGYYGEGEGMQNIPDLGAGFFVGVSEANNSCLMATYSAVGKEDYDNYITLMKKEGYSVACDNGETGINEDVFYTALTKDETTVHLVYRALPRQISVIVGNEEQISAHLTDSEAFREGNEDGRKTTMYFLDQVNGQALGIIFQLKNGHFIIYDGGMPGNADLVLRYLEELAPEGGLPVVEAWFITHGHTDHYGVLKTFSDHQNMCDRIIVNGIYVNQPNTEWMTETNSVELMTSIVISEKKYRCPMTGR